MEEIMKLMVKYQIDFIKTNEFELHKSKHTFEEPQQTRKSDFAELFDNEEDTLND